MNADLRFGFVNVVSFHFLCY